MWERLVNDEAARAISLKGVWKSCHSCMRRLLGGTTVRAARLRGILHCKFSNCDWWFALGGLRLTFVDFWLAVCGFEICDLRLPVSNLRLAVCDWRSAIGGLRWAVWDWRFAIGGFAIGGWRLAICDWRFAIGGLRLTVCDWLFAIDGLRCAIFDWWLVICELRFAIGDLWLGIIVRLRFACYDLRLPWWLVKRLQKCATFLEQSPTMSETPCWRQNHTRC